MRTLGIGFLFAALAILCLPARAQDCDITYNYAVMFKLKVVFGSDFPQGLDALTLSELGNRHWKARSLRVWADTLPQGCIGSEYRDWLASYLFYIEEEVTRRRVKHAPGPNHFKEQEQDVGHRLAKLLPTPGTPVANRGNMRP